MFRVPFNRACLAGREYDYIAEAVRNGQISGDGPFTKKCQEWLREYFRATAVLLTTSCTDALEMAAILLNIQPGDEVIIPSFTFVSAPNAFVLRGARPVFVDIRPDTLNMNELMLEALVTERTKAVVPVHYGGIACEMDAILEIANRHRLAVVEDNAHGLFGTYGARPLGSMGVFAAQSFHETKNITCGEGGALVINHAAYVERAEIIREKGTDRSRFFRGQTDKYTWVDAGSSFLPSDILAAFLWAQLEQREQIQAKRRRVWNNYFEALQTLTRSYPISLPFVPEHCVQPYHLFYILVDSVATRQALIDHLKARGILSVFHYLPLHLSRMGIAFGGLKGQCPVTEDVSDRLLRLPFYTAITEAEQAEVVEGIRHFYDHAIRSARLAYA